MAFGLVLLPIGHSQRLHLIERNCVARSLTAKHIALTRKQPAEAEFGEVIHDAAGQRVGDAVLARFDLVETLRAVKTDITSEVVCRHIGPPYNALKALTWCATICHIHFFLQSLQARPRSSMDRI